MLRAFTVIILTLCVVISVTYDKLINVTETAMQGIK